MIIGIIGNGDVAESYVRAYSTLKDVDGVVFFGGSDDCGRTDHQDFSVESVTSRDAFLSRVDAVSVCTPVGNCLDTVLPGLDCGVPLLIDLPMFSSSVEAGNLLDHVSSGSVAGVGSVLRFNPVVPEIAALLDTPRYVSLQHQVPVGSAGGSVVRSLMIQDLDIIRSYCLRGEYTISAVGSADAMYVLIKNGTVPIYLSANRRSLQRVSTIYLEQDTFTVEGDFLKQEVCVGRAPAVCSEENGCSVEGVAVERIVPEKADPLSTQLKVFAECVRTRTQFPISLGDAVKTLELCEQIERAALAGVKQGNESG